MYCKVLLLTVAYIVLVESNDLRLGFIDNGARKVYSEIKEANPALWKRTDEIAVNSVGSEVISAVYVTDLRDDKAGETYIENGGIGSKTVTIALKSPTVLRGYKFLVEVYANDPNARYYSKNGNQGYQQQQYNQQTYYPSHQQQYNQNLYDPSQQQQANQHVYDNSQYPRKY